MIPLRTPALLCKRSLQALLSGEAAVVDNAAALLEAVSRQGGEACSKLYLTGAFFFACAYRGSNLGSIASLFKATHLRYTTIIHLVGPEAMDPAPLPMRNRSVLSLLHTLTSTRTLLPSSVPAQAILLGGPRGHGPCIPAHEQAQCLGGSASRESSLCARDPRGPGLHGSHGGRL